MKYNNFSSEPSMLTDEQLEYVSSVSHRHDVDRKICGVLRFMSPVEDVTALEIADTTLDFELDLDNGKVKEDIQPNNDYQCDTASGEPIPTKEILGLQFVDRLGAMDKNFNPLGWQEVQSRLGLDKDFNPIPKADA